MTTLRSEQHAADVSVVIVTFNSSAAILRALRVIPPGCEIIVVDNASSDATVALLADCDIKLIALPENIGFGAASNEGAAVATREYVLFLNPDSVLEPGTVGELVEAARRDAHGVFNPEIVDMRGEKNNRAPRRYPNGQGASSRDGAQAPGDDMKIDVLSGAALLCPREIFLDVGGFDPELFLYFEDDDLSLRLLRKGFQLYRCPRAVVRHEGGASTLDAPVVERFKNYHWEKSYRYFCAKHGYRYQYAKRFLINLLRMICSFAHPRKGKFDKHWGRLLAMLGVTPQRMARRLHSRLPCLVARRSPGGVGPMAQRGSSGHHQVLGRLLSRHGIASQVELSAGR